MNKTRVNETVMQKAIRASADGKRVCDICKELNIHRNTFYLWKKKYQKIREDGRRRLDELEAENVRLRQRNSALEMNNRAIVDLLLS
ncbi:transposase [Parapedobacter indicus]|uniref:Putative transposase n=1 Tax=Parapedobacter indicus TaxID=1477437 RepID=A0A1I3RTP3_9SPHI|nr:transposase [Parapedobacter indicus]PPK99977.1 putative transposase [Parapedobacter indicus]SFJ49924.1 putative transposase [Parapedobacter indicus]